MCLILEKKKIRCKDLLVIEHCICGKGLSLAIEKQWMKLSVRLGFVTSRVNKKGEVPSKRWNEKRGNKTIGNSKGNPSGGSKGFGKGQNNRTI